MNFKLTIQYDGTEFHGWQIQDGLRTVQGELTAALSLIEGRSISLHGSGRTDAGVHAEAHVANVMLARDISCDKLRAAINGNVGSDVRVFSVESVSDDFHARYSAVEKTYVYRVVNTAVSSPFWKRYALHDARRLDLGAMLKCAEQFVGEHDWTAFSAAQADAVDRARTVTQLDISEHDDDRARGKIIEFRVSANGFLRYMVRSIAGALLAVGRGELELTDIRKAIRTGERPTAIATAPACGLTLIRVKY